MKRQAAEEVSISPCWWRTIVKSAAPCPLSINLVDCSIPIPNCRVLGKSVSWESELGKITKSDWFDLFAHAGFKKCTPAVCSKKSIYRSYTICIEVYFKQCSWLKTPSLDVSERCGNCINGIRCRTPTRQSRNSPKMSKRTCQNAP